MSNQPPTETIRNFLKKSFSEQELRRLSEQPGFEDLSLADRVDADWVIDDILAFCQRWLLIETLLTWAKFNNMCGVQPTSLNVIGWHELTRIFYRLWMTCHLNTSPNQFTI